MKYNILLVVLFLSFSGQAQNLITDRPGASDASVTVPNGYFHVEMGSMFYEDAGVQLWNVNNNLFRYGVANNVELRLITNLNLYKFAAKEKSELGVNDIEFGLKWGLINKDALQLAYVGHLIAPTGSTNSTADATGMRHKLSLSHPLNSRIGCTYNIGIDYFGQDNNALTYTYSIGFGLTDKWSFFTELYGDWFKFEEFSSSFDSGVAYIVRPDLQLDFSFGTGLTSDFNFYAFGISWRFPD